MNLANQSVEDLLGFPDGKGGYLLPSWVVSDEREDSRDDIDTSKPTLYFLDEINRGQTHILQCMFNFINEGRIHTFRIGKEDVIFAAGNPPSADYDVNEFEDEAFQSRFAHFYLEPSSTEFVDFLVESGSPKGFAEVFATSSELIDSSCTSKYHAKPNNRGIDRCRKFINNVTSSVFSKVGLDVMSALIGLDTAQLIKVSIENSEDSMTADQILKLKKVKEITFSKDDTDLIPVLSKSVADLLAVTYANDRIDVPAEVKKAINIFMNFIPRDAQACFLTQIMQSAGNSYFARTQLFDRQFLIDLVESSRD